MNEDTYEIIKEKLKKTDMEKTPHYDGPFTERKAYADGSPDKGQ